MLLARGNSQFTDFLFLFTGSSKIGLQNTLLTSQAVGWLSVNKLFLFPAVGMAVVFISVGCRVGIVLSSRVHLSDNWLSFLGIIPGLLVYN